MTAKKKPEIKDKAIKNVVIIPGQKSASDTSNWDDKAFGTPNGRELIPVLAEKSPKNKSVPKDHSAPKQT